MPNNHRATVSWLAPFALLGLLSFFVASPGWGQPSITLGKKGLIAQGITPGGRAIWWSVAHEHPDSFVTIVHRLEEQTDADLDGMVVFEREEPIPEISLWIAVDVTTGTYATYAPEDFGVTELALPAEAVVEGGGRSPADEFREVARPLVEVLLVRPGAGAWIQRAGDGGDTDQDGIEGEILFPIESMTPAGTSPSAPSRYLEGDLLLSIDVDQLELSSLVVPPPPAAGTGQEVGR